MRESVLILDRSKQGKLIRRNFYQNIEKFLLQKKLEASTSVFLLEEERFSFFSFDITDSFDQPVDIHYLNNLINQKKNEVFEQYGNVGEWIFYTIEEILVDGQSQNFLLNQKGEISFKLRFFYINYDMLNLFKAYAGSSCMQDINLKIYPQSYFTMHFLRDKLAKKNVNLLYILPKHIKLINISNGFYEDVQTMDLGIDKLKSIFHENNILGLYENSFVDKDLNDFSRGLIMEGMDFYCKMLSKWLAQYSQSKDIVLITQLVKNSYFIDSFSAHYKEFVNGYILPFHDSKELKKFGAEWDVSKMDILVYLNTL